MRRFLTGLGALGALGALALAVACGGGETPSLTQLATTAASGQDSGDTQVSGAALPRFEPGRDDPAIGRTPPVVTGPDLLTGEPVRIESRGRPMVLAFYAHWCPHCQTEVRELTAWLDDNDLPAGVDFMAVSVLEDPNLDNHPPARWLADAGWHHPVVADTAAQSVAEAFGLASVPYLVAVGADNTVELRYAGNVGPQQLAEYFATLLQ